MRFIDDNFLLENDYSRTLYFGSARDCPIVDFHNHLPVSDLCEDKQYHDIGTLWVCSDPYKHRAMRLMGLDERVISGEATSREKFNAWCGIVPYLIGNPLFHWSCLEMKRFFNFDDVPETGNADMIWDHCNKLLGEKSYSVDSLLRNAGVLQATTSDDLLDDTTRHRKASEVSRIDISPSLRADSILSFNPSWMDRLEIEEMSLEAYLNAVSRHLDLFASNGCRLSDHALDNGFVYIATTFEKASRLFSRLGSLCPAETAELKSFILGWLGRQYARRNWVMQLHIGAERWTSSRLRLAAGPAGGFACPGSACDIRSLCDFLDGLDKEGEMPKVILYPLNPSDNAALATLTGSFSQSGVQKVKFGPAWWFNDHIYGIEENLEILSSYSLLSQSLGMTTDSRNVLSFSRHEYFRRILCNWLGNKVAKGYLPADFDLLDTIVKDICYRNAKRWIYEQR
ncbi:MAG: glucuronate isomerase [Bacteroidales bacterium]|nr:glucuronate isomerase [Bacteroidales bacterium]